MVVQDKNNGSCDSGQRNVLKELVEINREWSSLALALKILPYQIEEIEANYPNSIRKCREKMVDKWFQRDSELSWNSLCVALRDPLVDRHDIARRIELKYQVLN